MRTLTLDEARAYYDSFGAKQDNEIFYEGPAVKKRIENGHFYQASSVVVVWGIASEVVIAAPIKV